MSIVYPLRQEFISTIYIDEGYTTRDKETIKTVKSNKQKINNNGFQGYFYYYLCVYGRRNIFDVVR